MTADTAPSPQLVARAIRALPASVPAPDQCIDHDGAVSLDWQVSRSRMFSVSIDAAGRLGYAWVDGEQHGHGVGVFDRAWPVSMLQQLEGVIGDR